MSLNNEELILKMKSLAHKERELLYEVLITIKEIDQRKLYLDLGYTSLFVYLTKALSYSEGSAQRRIDAARILKEIPELKENIKSGKITLSHISLVQRASREKKIPKKEALNQISSLPLFKAQKVMAENFHLNTKEPPKITPQSNGDTRIAITLTKEQYEKLEKVKHLFSHQVPDGDLAKLLELLLNQAIKQKSTATVAVKRETLEKHQHCQYEDPKTGIKCESQWQLEMDHKHAKWAKGTNDPENLQILCRNHNQHKYRKEAGIRYQ